MHYFEHLEAYKSPPSKLGYFRLLILDRFQRSDNDRELFARVIDKQANVSQLQLTVYPLFEGRNHEMEHSLCDDLLNNLLARLPTHFAYQSLCLMVRLLE